MIFNVVSLSSDFYNFFLNFGVIYRSFIRKKFFLNFYNLKRFSFLRNYSTSILGSSFGLLISFDCIKMSLFFIKHIYGYNSKVIYLSPNGRKINQSDIKSFSMFNNLIFVIGKYDGLDNRCLYSFVDDEVSVGNYVLSSGDYSFILLLDAVVRLLPNNFYKYESIINDSFMKVLFDNYNYSYSFFININNIPLILFSGDIVLINTWKFNSQIVCTLYNKESILNYVNFVYVRRFILKNVFLKRQYEYIRNY